MSQFRYHSVRPLFGPVEIFYILAEKQVNPLTAIQNTIFKTNLVGDYWGRGIWFKGKGRLQGRAERPRKQAEYNQMTGKLRLKSLYDLNNLDCAAVRLTYYFRTTSVDHSSVQYRATAAQSRCPHRLPRSCTLRLSTDWSKAGTGSSVDYVLVTERWHTDCSVVFSRSLTKKTSPV